MNILENYGLKNIYIEESKNYPNFKLARVITQYKGLYKIVTESNEKLVEISRKLKRFLLFQTFLLQHLKKIIGDIMSIVIRLEEEKD